MSEASTPPKAHGEAPREHVELPPGYFEGLSGQTQREVNAGVRATFSAVHTTLRSQGSAIRGLEELLKKALPELDRLKREVRSKAEAADVVRTSADVEAMERQLVKLHEELRTQHLETQRALDSKCDVSTGKRALELSQKWQETLFAEAAAHAEGKHAQSEASTRTIKSFWTNQLNQSEVIQQMEMRLTAAERQLENTASPRARARAFPNEEPASKLEVMELRKRLDSQVHELTEAREAVTRLGKHVDSILLTDLRHTLGLQQEAIDQLNAESEKRSKAALVLGGLSTRMEKLERECALNERRMHEKFEKLQHELSQVVQPQLAELEAQQVMLRSGMNQQLSITRSSLETTISGELTALQALTSSTQEKMISDVGTLREQLNLVRDQVRHITENQQQLARHEEMVQDWHAQALASGHEISSHLATFKTYKEEAQTAMQEAGTANLKHIELQTKLSSLLQVLESVASRQTALEDRLAHTEMKLEQSLQQTIPVTSHLQSLESRLELVRRHVERAPHGQQKKDIGENHHGDNGAQFTIGEVGQSLDFVEALQQPSENGDLRRASWPSHKALSGPASVASAAVLRADLLSAMRSEILDAKAGTRDESMLDDSMEARLSAAEAAQSGRDEEMRVWSERHARILNMLMSEALCGRWVGSTSDKSVSRDGGAAVLVEWQAQSANSHPECYGWIAGAHEVTVADAGLYELSAGVWPDGARSAEVRINGIASIKLSKPAMTAMTTRLSSSALIGQVQMNASEIVGLYTACVVALPAASSVSLVTEAALYGTRAFLGLRKL
ncbi:hypothetical protein AB1Y20_001021 [Prymnesium parvum]|uniref:Uncharacterized protein n=1 Tax=Prymnesium parvum TaxID=97485 RepID=A0AB34K6I5_PRYPA